MDTIIAEELLCHIIRDCTDNLATDQTLIESVSAFMEDNKKFQEYQKKIEKEYTLLDLLRLAKQKIRNLNHMLSDITEDWD